jgi:sugar lactone lactonase YvrE
VEGRPLNEPNDLAFDRRGNLIFTCPGNSRQEPTGDVCCLSPAGQLHVAVYGAGQVQVFDPTGTQVAAHDLPGKNPTNCAFDPSGRLGLVVTEAEKGLLLSLPGLGPGLALFQGGDR